MIDTLINTIRICLNLISLAVLFRVILSWIGVILGVFFDVKNPMKVGVELLSCAMKLVLFRAWRRHQLISRIDVAGGQISRLRSWLWSFACEALLAT
jgi:Zn-dependent membrane protease YugP